jgi:hypothetical protein
MKQLLLFSALAGALLGNGQTTYKKHIIKSEKLQVIDPKLSQNDYQAQLFNLEAPSPDGDSYRSFLMRQKRAVAKKYPRKVVQPATHKTSGTQPAVNRGMRITRVLFSQTRDVIGGIPSDNTLAVSDSGIVLCAINSLAWAYDIQADTTHFMDQVKSLRNIGGGSINDNNFDPKLMYDPDADRWILVYLQNNTPTNSRIKVCFSTTNDPEDPWNSYVLPGNPLNNNRWTDFPSISLTEDELFITGNLIVPDVSWQVGFDGSVIWQVDKNAGYAGDSILTNALWSDIKFDGKFTRNLHPVWGASGNATEAFFLSNRNFDIANDTIFVLHVTGTIDDPNAELIVKASKANPGYGVPPNGRQEDTDLSDPTKGLQTNDARVLGAITNGTWIQYVSTTVVPSTGFAGVYHGLVTDIYDDPKVNGNIISHPTRDYGYPNLAYTGDEDCDIETMIGFNYTSPTDYAGVGVIYFGNDSLYSDPIDLKAGENYTDRHSDSYERWGDYFGAQRKFNEPKKVWLAGYFGNQNQQNATWVSEVASLDTAKLYMDIAQTGSALFCDATITISAGSGVAPFRYSFNGQPFESNNRLSGICGGDTVEIVVQDARGCELRETYLIEKTIAPDQPAAFPNPFFDRMAVQFNLPQAQELTISIADETGRLIEVILNQPAQAGQNELLFSLQPLRQGIYFLRIEGSAGFSFTDKILKL